MHKRWIIYSIFSTILVSCNFIQYHISLKPQENELQLPAGRTIGLAPQFKTIKPISARKEAFFSYLVPGIEYENNLTLIERQKILSLQDKFLKNKEKVVDFESLEKIAKKYRLNPPEQEDINHQWFDKLLEKVDVLPVPLVLIQAANESAWGTSRFATQGNNYFGQWCYKSGCGLVPLQRGKGKVYEVAKFSSVQNSIHHYFLNVNRNKAYQELRSIRAQRRALEKSMMTEDAAFALTQGLLNYSERGQHYIDSLNSMLRHNSKYWNLDSK